MTKITTLQELVAAISGPEDVEVYYSTGSEWKVVTNWSYWTVNELNIIVNSGKARIKAKKTEVDMLPFLKNGIDCEFSGLHGNKRWYVGKLGSIVHSDRKFVDMHRDCWVKCRPRLNHPFILSSQELPEGLIVEYGYYNEGTTENPTWKEEKVYDNVWNLVRIVGCKEGYVFPGCSND